jgi:hypothetical protein
LFNVEVVVVVVIGFVDVFEAKIIVEEPTLVIGLLLPSGWLVTVAAMEDVGGCGSSLEATVSCSDPSKKAAAAASSSSSNLVWVHFELVSDTEVVLAAAAAVVDFEAAKVVGSSMGGMREIVAEATAPEVAVGWATVSVVFTAVTLDPSILAMAIEVAATELRSEAAEC